MRDLIRKIKAVLTAVPTYGALAVAALTFVSTSIVPVLPVALGVKVAVWAASALGVVQAIVSVVSRVTPIVFPEDKGLLSPSADVPDPWEPFWSNGSGDWRDVA